MPFALRTCAIHRGHKLYYVFGFLFIVFLILVITTIESTILLCYFHLCSEVRCADGGGWFSVVRFFFA